MFSIKINSIIKKQFMKLNKNRMWLLLL